MRARTRKVVKSKKIRQTFVTSLNFVSLVSSRCGSPLPLPDRAPGLPCGAWAPPAHSWWLLSPRKTSCTVQRPTAPTRGSHSKSRSLVNLVPLPPPPFSPPCLPPFARAQASARFSHGPARHLPPAEVFRHREQCRPQGGCQWWLERYCQRCATCCSYRAAAVVASPPAVMSQRPRARLGARAASLRHAAWLAVARGRRPLVAPPP